MKHTADEILSSLTDEDYLNIKKSTGKDKPYVIDVVTGKRFDPSLKMLTEYLVMQGTLGVHNKEVRLIMHEITTQAFQNAHR